MVKDICEVSEINTVANFHEESSAVWFLVLLGWPRSHYGAHTAREFQILLVELQVGAIVPPQVISVVITWMKTSQN